MSGWRDRFLFSLVGWAGSLLILGLGKTLRITWEGREIVEDIHRRGGNVLYAIWHGRMLLLSFSHRGQGIRILVSQHRDGEFIARILRRLGFVPVRGSTTRGGTRAFFDLAHRGKSGNDLGITPDGPKGPPQSFQMGALYLAQRSDLPLVPMTWSANRRWVLASWDGFVIPKPFSRCLLLIGPPIQVPPDTAAGSLERLREQCEQALRSLTEEADRRMRVVS